MTEPATYAGPVEAITLDEAAVRCRLSRESFDKHYDGPRVRIGREVRIKLDHLSSWLDRMAGLESSEPKAWGDFDADADEGD
ncbi:MAG: hypothetical protein PVI23_07020 [Maricaulaceae bacterium]